MEISIETWVPVPVSDAFRMVRDLPYMIPRIDSDVVSLKQVGDGPIGLGTRWAETVRAFPGLNVKVDLEVTTYAPGREIGLRFDSKVMSGQGKTICEASNQGTRVTVRFEARACGIGRLLTPLVHQNFAARGRRRGATFTSKVQSGELTAAGAASL